MNIVVDEILDMLTVNLSECCCKLFENSPHLIYIFDNATANEYCTGSMAEDKISGVESGEKAGVSAAVIDA
jgi:hypothetical protein